MTEKSYFWGGTVTGDASLAPYDDDEFSDMMRLFLQGDRAVQGVIQNYLNELEVTGTATPVSVNTGAAMVDGKLYINDAASTVAIPTPAASTRIDCIVLRKDFVAQTIRITRIAGVEGGAAPAITQSDGATWDLKLAEASITTGGVITVTDFREPHLFAPVADVDAGVANHLHISPYNLAQSIFGKFKVAIGVVAADAQAETGDGKAFFTVPTELSGATLIGVAAGVLTAGTTGTMDIQLRDVDGAADILSTKMTIDSGEYSTYTAATPAVINGSYDTFAAGDPIRVDIDAVHTTPAYGLIVFLIFRVPS